MTDKARASANRRWDKKQADAKDTAASAMLAALKDTDAHFLASFGAAAWQHSEAARTLRAAIAQAEAAGIK
jgi:hypothetical protein